MLEGKWVAGDIIGVDADEKGEKLVFSKRTGEIPAPRHREHMDLPRSHDSWNVEPGLPSPAPGGAASSQA